MPNTPIDPNRIFRECEARDIFGYSPSRLRELIKSGSIPAPVLLNPPPSRARGWYGWMINDHRARVEAEQVAWAAATTDTKGEAAEGLRYAPKGGDLSKQRTARPSPTVKPEKLKGLKRPDLPRRSQKG